MDTWGTPQGILDTHAPDQGTQICLDLWPTAQGSGFPVPISAKASTVPSHQGFGPYDRDGLEDRWKPPVQLDEASLQHNQLTSKNGVLSLEPALRLEWQRKQQEA